MNRRRLMIKSFLVGPPGKEEAQDADYILGTFPIVKREDEAAHGRYLTRDLILGYMAAFAAGDADARIEVS